MRPHALVPFAYLFVLLASTAVGQPRPAAEFQISKITRNLITAPDFTYTGAQQYETNQRDRWLEVEVEFVAAPEFTDELTCKYFVLLSGKLLTGEVTHLNIPAGRDNRSVMYVAPRSLARIMSNRALTENAVQNIAVQLMQRGTLKSELSLGRAPPQWFASLPSLPGFLLSKNETPFAPLYWDRYLPIKAAHR